MAGGKTLQGFARLEEVLPVLDAFMAEECLSVASSLRNIVTEGMNREDVQPRTSIVMYPRLPNVSARIAMDSSGPSRAIVAYLPLPSENQLPEFYITCVYEWWEGGRSHVDREVVPRFDRLKRRLLKIMCLGPYETYDFKTNVTYDVCRGSHYSQGALDWFNEGGEWFNSNNRNIRYRPQSD